MRDLFDSVVRTVVPVVVGAVLAWVAGRGITVDPEFELALTAALTAGFTSIYYVIVRLVETYVSPKLGVLLGLAKPPVYDHRTVTEREADEQAAESRLLRRDLKEN